MTPTDAIAQARLSATQRQDVEAAADGFESLLWGEVLKTMRRSVGGDASFARSTYTSMMDEQLARILAEQTTGLDQELERQLGAELQPDSLAGLLSGPEWTVPVSGSIVFHHSQSFGAERPGHIHQGIDFGRREGTPVGSARDGIVTRINRNPETSGGIWVEVKHDQGLTTRYMHLSAVRDGLSVGDAIAAGQELGAVGNTGPGSHGAHLHFEIR
ncbi:MAG: peptidoglycan DD-metalloendopeptidase family protein, partial [Myxococcota bacterium]